MDAPSPQEQLRDLRNRVLGLQRAVDELRADADRLEAQLPLNTESSPAVARAPTESSQGLATAAWTPDHQPFKPTLRESGTFSSREAGAVVSMSRE